MRPREQTGNRSQATDTNDASHQHFDEEQVSSVYRFMYRHLGNREEAEALTEQTFMATLRAMPQDTPTRQSVDTLLCQTARQVASEYLRQFYPNYHETPDDECEILRADTPATHRERANISVTVECLLAQLPERDRNLLTYRLLRNLSLAEAATQMRLSLSDALALQWSALVAAAAVAVNDGATSVAPCGCR
jgi:RNA polymerase sigma factor (sigma-70 family)